MGSRHVSLVFFIQYLWKNEVYAEMSQLELNILQTLITDLPQHKTEQNRSEEKQDSPAT